MSTQRSLHLANADQRNATVIAIAVSATGEEPILGLEGKPATFRRFVAAGAGTLDSELAATLGDDYAQALIDADPEIDTEVVGRFIESTQAVLLSSAGEPLFAAPTLVEVAYSATGEEISRRDPVDLTPTVTDSIPLRWTGRTMPKQEAVRKFAFRRTLQIRHSDGVTYDFLFDMARRLAERDEVVLLAAGESGKEPIVLQVNGSPYRGFLEGRVNGERYQLLLHLSNLELKRPATRSKDADEAGEESAS